MKFLSVLIALFIGSFWAGVAALAFPTIVLPVFLITSSVSFIALGLCLAGSMPTEWEQEHI